MPNITIQLTRFKGTTETLKIWLHLAGQLLNVGGTDLVEIGHGEFEAALSESPITTNYGVYVTDASNRVVWGDGVLYAGEQIVDQIPANGSHDVATLAQQQTEILAKLSRPFKVHHNPPRPDHIEVIRGDAYDGSGTGKSHPKLSWNFGKDISGKPFAFTIRRKTDTADAVPLLEVAGVGAGQLAEPVLTSLDTIQLPVSRCSKDLKFDVEVKNADNSYQTQLGTCTVLEDQTRR